MSTCSYNSSILSDPILKSALCEYRERFHPKISYRKGTGRGKIVQVEVKFTSTCILSSHV